MTDLQAALSNRFGEHLVSILPTKEGEMSLLVLDIELNSPVTLIMTNGLSAYKMPVHEKMKGREFNELYFCLPSYWKWEELDNELEDEDLFPEVKPPKRSKKKKKTDASSNKPPQKKNKKDLKEFGNDWSDGSPDPKDYI